MKRSKKMHDYYCRRYGGIAEVPRAEDNPVLSIVDTNVQRFLTVVSYEKPLSDEEIKRYELTKVGTENLAKYSTLSITELEEVVFLELQDKGLLNQKEAYSGDWWYGWDFNKAEEFFEKLSITEEIEGLDIHILHDEDWKVYLYPAKKANGVLEIDCSQEIAVFKLSVKSIGNTFKVHFDYMEKGEYREEEIKTIMWDDKEKDFIYSNEVVNSLEKLFNSDTWCYAKSEV